MSDLIQKAKAFADLYNDLESFPTLNDLATHLECSIRRIQNRVGEYRALQKIQPELVDLTSRAGHRRPDIPMSEHQEKFKDWTAEQCVEELRRVQMAYPERDITRMFFRNNSVISDSVWSQHFGTFEEYKRQASLQLSRGQHALERQIAKHASVDHLRQMNIERQDWADKYERGNANRFKSILVCSDLHDEEVDMFFMRVMIDTAKRLQPDVIVFNGDIFDLPEFGKYGVDPREWNVVGRIKFAHEHIFKALREACPDAQFDFIEGNHEARLLRQLAEATPALRAVLSDLHGFTISKLLGLDEFQINYIAKADLAAWTKRDFDKEIANNYKIYYDTVLCHHFPDARNMGLPGLNGHHHRHQVWPMFSPIYGAYEWHQLGAGHKRDASYCNGEKWHNGFAIVNVDTLTKATNFDYISVTDFAVSGGKWYHREGSEFYRGV